MPNDLKKIDRMNNFFLFLPSNKFEVFIGLFKKWIHILFFSLFLLPFIYYPWLLLSTSSSGDNPSDRENSSDKENSLNEDNTSEKENSSEENSSEENSSEENSSEENSIDEDVDQKLNSILSDREKLNAAKNNDVDPEDRKKALEDLQNKYPDLLENVENKEEFLENIHEKLLSKAENIKKKYKVQDDEDIEHNAPEEIVDDLDLIDKARQGDPDALSKLENIYPQFFDEESNNESYLDALNQIEQMLEEDFEGELEREEKNADKIDEEVKKDLRLDNPRLTEAQVQELFNSLKEKPNKRKREDSDDNDSDSDNNSPKETKNKKIKKEDSNDNDSDNNSKGGGTSGPSIGSSAGGSSGEGPSGEAPSGESSSNATTSSEFLSPIDYILEKYSDEFPSIYELGGDD